MIEESVRLGPAAEAPLHVVATAGHVDHGKSSLILRLTGTDPDRWAEEKRRGLTIDLGFAWCTLPSGREIGFVDVPGHERFVRNMLAGVGPVRLVLFVVAADEGWKPQSEEHLAIVDVLGANGGVVALTKCDLVDEEAVGLVIEDVRDRLRGTVMQDAPIVPCSSQTGEGLDGLAEALDAMVGSSADPAEDERQRLFVDRIFTVTGAGTIVTGTLTGGRLAVGQEVELLPAGGTGRIRGLQTHKRSIQVARPVSRVAANLVGVDREGLGRGDVLGLPGEWRPTRMFEVRLRPVRGLAHPLTTRGAYKVYAGSAERGARIRLYGTGELTDPEGCFARIRVSDPLVLDVHDRFVVRDAGRRETVAGGVVLDVDPPIRPGRAAPLRLGGRERAARGNLPPLLVSETGAVRASDLIILTGTRPSAIDGAERTGAWWVAKGVVDEVSGALEAALAAFHKDHPLDEGLELARARGLVLRSLEEAGAPGNASLADALLSALSESGRVVREGSTVRLASHAASLVGREEEAGRLVRAVADAEPTPPTVQELTSAGFSPEVIHAAARAGMLVRLSRDLVMTPGLVARAEALIRGSGKDGITVSAFREAMGTSRKYALPLLEHLDQAKVTVRRGDLRFPREPAPSA
ncbi:MAG TPA: selenocysteine-specific translation elongation factor [Actinomycetota bacterium]|nr:selenocysteine-specific translation elongation factor [Actinomycetota bacterium]